MRAAGSRRTVLVTGASSGIGRATAGQLARAGDDVVLVSRSAVTLGGVAAELTELGARVVVAAADVRDAGAVRAAFDRAEVELGPVDAVVHAAAVLAFGRFEDVPADVFDEVVRTNLVGTANVAREVFERADPARTTTLVVIGSTLGRLSAPYLSSYTATKWAVHGLVRALQVEARRTPHVRLGLVTPSGVDTPIYDHCGSYTGRGSRPPPPVVTPERVAEVVIRSLDRPRRNAPVGPGSNVGALASRLVPGIYDRVIGPYMEHGTMTRTPAPHSPGNVFETAGPYAERGVVDVAHVPPTRSQGAPMNLTSSVVRVEREVAAPAEAVWQVLSDGWLYATWVVGASRVRDVDHDWPATGARIHHSVGLWPALINDTTHVLHCEPGQELALKARGWPAGEAEVVLTLEERGPGACTVTIAEDAVSGPGTLVPQPVRQLMIGHRNTEALLRLALLAEGRWADPGA